METRLLNTKQAAAFLTVSPAFLERDRWAGARIPFVKIGNRSIRYRVEDLEDFIDRQIKTSTSEGAT
jgi:predicted DNA-binding transcriptional regulator AlpA